VGQVREGHVMAVAGVKRKSRLERIRLKASRGPALVAKKVRIAEKGMAEGTREGGGEGVSLKRERVTFFRS